MNAINVMDYFWTHPLWYKNLVDGVYCFSGVLTNNGSVDDDLEIFGIRYRIISTNLLFVTEYAHIPGKHLYIIHKLHA